MRGAKLTFVDSARNLRLEEFPYARHLDEHGVDVSRPEKARADALYSRTA